MANLNLVAITGRITKDLEIKKSGTGKSILSFSIATTDMSKKTCFFNVVLFSGVADFIANYGAKGTLVTIKGRLDTNEYTNHEGKKISNIQIIGETAEIIKAAENKKNDEYNNHATNYEQNTKEGKWAAGESFDNANDVSIDINSDDLPF